jgi:hypothetical protein
LQELQALLVRGAQQVKLGQTLTVDRIKRLTEVLVFLQEQLWQLPTGKHMQARGVTPSPAVAARSC